ncbi:MAG: single-stranded DNA-binding protein [Chitinophagales bacterium]|nr:single-stranded DNA-binding protein [Chitinophagales bacterium]
MRGINKVTLLGRLGKDPETQYLESGTPLSRFTLATNDRYKDKSGNWVDQTEWHNLVLWRGLAEIAEKYLKKGSLVYIEGKLRTRSWEDNGVKKYSTEIVADNLIMLDRKEDGEHPSGGFSNGGAAPMGANVDEPDDLPF